MGAGEITAADEIAIPGLDVPKAKRYSRIRLGLMVAATGWTVVRLAWFADRRRSARLRQAIGRRIPDQRLARSAFVATATVLAWSSSLPLAYVGAHLVERRFGLTKQGDRDWLVEQVKGLAVGLALQVPLLTAAFAVIRRRPRDWWLVLAGATVPLAVVVSHLAPIVVMPLFNRFDPLQDQALATRLRRLAERAGVPIAEVFAMDMSRQSEKPNAFFTGLGNSKRIVLGDTLIQGFPPQEVDAVVAHELGHQVHGDIWRLIAFGSAIGFAVAYATYQLAPRLVARTASRTGVDDLGDEASLPVFGLVLAGVGLLVTPLQAAFSRAIERRTDGYALALTGDGDSYAATLARLASRSLADPDPPAPVVFFLYSHPPMAERIAAAHAYAAGRRPDLGVPAGLSTEADLR